MGRMESYLGSGLTILVLSCGLAVVMALVQSGLALAARGDLMSGRGLLFALLGIIGGGCAVAGIARFLNPRN